MFVGVFIFSNICKYLNEWRSAISIYIYRGERDALIAREEFIEQISHWGEEKDVPAPRKYFILKIKKKFFFSELNLDICYTDPFIGGLRKFVIISLKFKLNMPRGLNGSVLIPEHCDFWSRYDQIKIIFSPFPLNTFLSAYAF